MMIINVYDIKDRNKIEPLMSLDYQGEFVPSLNSFVEFVKALSPTRVHLIQGIIKYISYKYVNKLNNTTELICLLSLQITKTIKDEE